MDIRFYDFEFNILYILPSFSKDIGYTSCNTVREFNGPGSFEIVFVSDELKDIVEKHKNDLFITWGDFQGILTGYQWNDRDKSASIFGFHMNCLLERRIITEEFDEETGNKVLSGYITKLTKTFINKYYDFLEWKEVSVFGDSIDYEPESYASGNTIIQNLLSKGKAGYLIYADIPNKKYTFQVLEPKENPIMFSISNLNAYDIVESYDNKSYGTGGWYKEEREETTTDSEGKTETKTIEEWKYYNKISAVSGIYKKEILLSSDSEEKATTEFDSKIPFNQVSLNTRNVKYGEDYALGDIVRCQTKNVAVKKQITSINRWYEKELGEKPILSEV